jgi:hypothetical protein
MIVQNSDAGFVSRHLEAEPFNITSTYLSIKGNDKVKIKKAFSKLFIYNITRVTYDDTQWKYIVKFNNGRQELANELCYFLLSIKENNEDALIKVLTKVKKIQPMSDWVLSKMNQVQKEPNQDNQQV